MHKMSENFKPTYGGYSSALGGETSDLLATPTFVDMALYDLVSIYCVASGVASDSVLTLKAYEATDSNGSGSATVAGATDTFTSTNTTDVDVLQVQVRAADLSSGFQYVGAKISTSNGSGTEQVAMVILQGKPRYGQATLA